MITFKEYLLEWSNIPNGIITTMRKKGYSMLGSGVDQVAFLSPNKKNVIKIFGTNNEFKNDSVRFSRDQKMFLHFVDYCEANKSNPFLPKILGWEPFIFDGKTYIQYRMELLYSLAKSFSPQLYSYMYNLTWRIDNTNLSKKEFVKKFMDQSLASEHDGDDINLKDLNAILSIHMGGKVKLFINTIFDLSELAKQYDYILDLHGGNFMVSSNGTIVIVDPWIA